MSSSSTRYRVEHYVELNMRRGISYLQAAMHYIKIGLRIAEDFIGISKDVSSLDQHI